MRALISLLLVLGCAGCGPGFEAIKYDLPPVGEPADGLIVKSRSVFLVTTENGKTVVQRIQSFILPVANAANPTSIPISVVNAPNAQMTVNSANFAAPTITNDSLEFGSLTITQLRDNNLKVCGSNGKQKCGLAVIRMYTTGAAGAGLYNSADSFGAPITAGMGSIRELVGLGAVNAAIVQTYTIPANRNSIRETNFTPQPMTYNVSVDFTEAGTGTYSTTLVVEYGLAL